MTRRATGYVLVGLAILALTAGFWLRSRRDRVPSSGSAAYDQFVTQFYRGLASLETGLLDNAAESFARATDVAPGEASAWANLAVTRLRAAQFDAASRAIARARSLAPRSGSIATIEGGLEAARGHADVALAAYRSAVAIEPDNARARFAIVELLEGIGSANEGEAATELEQLHDRDRSNLAVLTERARLAARREDWPRLTDSVQRLGISSNGWPDAAKEQLVALRAAVDQRNAPGAVRAAVVLRNILARVPEFRADLAAIRVPPELLAEPLVQFVRAAPAMQRAAEPDTALRYALVPIEDGRVETAVVTPLDASQDPSVLVMRGASFGHAGSAQSWPLPPGTAALVPIDWNHDFRVDVAVSGDGGTRLMLQAENGEFGAAASRVGLDSVENTRSHGAWPADLDMDGDLDLVVGIVAGAAVALRNNGDGTATSMSPFQGVLDVGGFAWADLDADGDPDAALLDGAGTIHTYVNRQGGRFDPDASFALGAAVIAVGDLDANGVFELVAPDRGGALHRLSRAAGRWTDTVIADVNAGQATPSRVLLGDFDNNGAIDVLIASRAGSRVWLSDGQMRFTPLAPSPTDVVGASDFTGDGLLDFVAIADGSLVRLVAQGSKQYHWQSIRPRAQTATGDQRINSFAVGGEIEVRAGLLVQKQLITGLPVHAGLGTRTAADVARIVWPNGVAQAEFDLGADRTIVADQRLKGSCPWVFADDGHGLRFVTDFLWRSPLGLRINAQDTAGVTQTEDRIRIGGDQLVARDGHYDIRITAELWETHFFDHVSLLAVDHPVGTDAFVDESFPVPAKAAAVQLVRGRTAVSRAWDDQGQDVTPLVAVRDGQHVAGFERGEYQGIAREHAIEFELGEGAPAAGPLSLIAQGWVYPTDSSINLAIAQGTQAPPHGLVLEARARDRWIVLNPNVGFPAGKNKTMVIDLSARQPASRRFRLRTNMEIYWDALSWAIPAVDEQPQEVRIPAVTAELRYRGFSRTVQEWDAHAPEVPVYDGVANTAARWRDLTGYHTRFGDVRDLLTQVDDRYVIMNAGDELRLAFPALPAPAAGQVRDFVLIGDGWEKDGDFNTGFSETVLPLPRHDDARYDVPPLDLEHDPAYLLHPEDWLTYHTRFVAPDRYLGGLSRTLMRKP